MTVGVASCRMAGFYLLTLTHTPLVHAAAGKHNTVWSLPACVVTIVQNGLYALESVLFGDES